MTPAWIEDWPKQAADTCLLLELIKSFPTRVILELLFCFGKGWEDNEKVGLTLFCPITSQVKGYPFDVILTDGLLVSGAILADQVKSLDWQARQIKKIGALPHKKMQELLQKIGALILWIANFWEYNFDYRWFFARSLYHSKSLLITGIMYFKKSSTSWAWK